MRRSVFILAGLALLLAGGALAQVFTEANGLRMSERGAAGVTADTAFRRDAIANALPGLRIYPGTAMAEGDSSLIYLAADRIDVLLRIHGRDGRVTMIEGLTPKVYGPGRNQIGMRFSQVDGQYLAYCEPGMEEWSGAVFCGAQPGAALWFVFQPDWAGPDGQLPPPDALAGAELVQIRWTARDPAGDNDAGPPGAAPAGEPEAALSSPRTG